MINVFKSGGDWKSKDGKEYTVKTIEESNKAEHLKDGWVLCLSEIKKPVAKKKPAAKKATK